MIRFEHLTLGYGPRILLDDAAAAIPAGSLAALIGRNGSGKSTLLRAVAGLERCRAGRIRVDGRDVAAFRPGELARTVAVVTTERVRIANLRCRDAVALGRAPYTNWMGRMQSADEAVVAESLRAVGMEAWADRPLDRMSDGESQRILIARALAQQTPVILLDEPTSFLDIPNRYGICRLLRRLAREQGKTILFSTHELDLALEVCDSVVLLDPPQLHHLPSGEMRRSGLLAPFAVAEWPESEGR